MSVEKHLPPGQFDSVMRYVKITTLDRVKALKTATWSTLKRLGVKRDVRRAKRRVPMGSDQGNPRSIIDWLNKVQPEDVEAVRQVVEIDATCCRRVNG